MPAQEDLEDQQGEDKVTMMTPILGLLEAFSMMTPVQGLLEAFSTAEESLVPVALTHISALSRTRTS